LVLKTAQQFEHLQRNTRLRTAIRVAKGIRRGSFVFFKGPGHRQGIVVPLSVAGVLSLSFAMYMLFYKKASLLQNGGVLTA